MQVARHPGSINGFSLTTAQVYKASHLLKLEELEESVWVSKNK